MSSSEIVRRTFGVEVRSVDMKERSVRVIASTSAIDSYGDIVEQSWRLDRYLANPVVLWNHNRSGGFFSSPSADETLPIGFSKDVEVVGNKLEATLVFVDEKASPLAEKVFQGFVQKSIRAVSVGFRPNNVKAEKLNGREIYRLSDNELFEISATPIPANPEAVAKAADDARVQLRALAARGAGDTRMDIEKIEAELKAAKDETAKQSESIKALETQVADLTKSISALTSERDEAKASLAKAEKTISTLETKALEDHVKSFVGKKFAPAELPAQLKFAKIDRAAFDEGMAARPDLTLTEQTSVLGEDGAKSAVVDGEQRGESLAGAIFG